MPSTQNAQNKALKELEALVAPGPRFHGTPGIDLAREFLSGRLEELGLTVHRQKVETPGWRVHSEASLEVLAPSQRSLPSWPMLWSGATEPVEATLEPRGLQGLWGDAMTWTKFAAVKEGKVVAYVHARDVGPAAPQPAPLGSDNSVAHLAVGRVDGLQLSEWLEDGHKVRVRLGVDCGADVSAVSDNLRVEIPGTSKGNTVVLCGHYDTFWNTPGAYDNGSGTIALLLLASRLLDNPPMQPVQIVFFTAEEWHLAGSRQYVSSLTAAEREDISYAINLDGLGRGSHLEMFAGPETFEESVYQEVRLFGKTDRPNLKVTSRFPPTCGTDHAAFYSAGVPSAHLTFNDLHKLHQPDDLPNIGIASNISWTVDLVLRLLASLEKPERGPAQSLGIPM